MLFTYSISHYICSIINESCYNNWYKPCGMNIVCAIAAFLCSERQYDRMPDKTHKLPETVRPSNYELAFDVNMETFSFLGKEKIDVNISAPTKKIILNAMDIDVKSAVAMTNGKKLAARTEMDTENQVLILHLPEKISGNAEIFLEFEGKLNDNLVGFYRSKVIMPDGSARYAASTHFEAPYAHTRRRLTSR